MAEHRTKKSIFRSLVVPMIIIMVLQSVLFYVVAVYGGVEESLSSNATNILAGQLYSRKNEIDTQFNNRWTDLHNCITAIDELYASYEHKNGPDALIANEKLQIEFLSDSSDTLISTLRHAETNGVFLILNNIAGQRAFSGHESRYGLCVRDLDQVSSFTGTSDLLLERGPSSLVDSIGCPLDSWWEARYSFDSEEEGSYYYAPINAAWDAPQSKGRDLAYISDAYRISGSDTEMISYSVPLKSESGYPYAVLGVELSTKYLASLLPNRELISETDRSCYCLALWDGSSADYRIQVGSGAFYNRVFGSETVISGKPNDKSGLTFMGRDGTELFVKAEELETYNTNSPFADRKLMLMAIVHEGELFSYISHIKTTLVLVSAFSLLLGFAGVAFVSRRFAAPITALAKRVHDMDDETRTEYALERVGVVEIDQLVDSIEELNRNVSRDSARTEFFSRMSHDMRTPMNAIISFSSEELLENADEAVKDDYLLKIHTAGTYLLGLINEVLDMTKIESKKTELHVNCHNAAALFETIVPIIDKLAVKKSVSFTCDIQVDSQVYVMADEQHLNQVLINLLSNAVKFTPQGGNVKLAVSIPHEGDIRVCTITVSDTGIGMSKEFMQKLYSPFMQEGGQHEGTGLGLSIAKKLVVLMNGEIECRSEKNVGTTFTVMIPLKVTEAACEKLARVSRDVTCLKGKRVLICEDNEINTVIIVNLLERVGVIADVAENGRIGVSMFASAPQGTYAAVLMDIRMPVMNGHEATKAIRRLNNEAALSVPIIAMTADAFEEDARSSIAAGMNEHLSKPIEPEKLYDVLLRYV